MDGRTWDAVMSIVQHRAQWEDADTATRDVAGGAYLMGWSGASNKESMSQYIARLDVPALIGVLVAEGLIPADPHHDIEQWGVMNGKGEVWKQANGRLAKETALRHVAKDRALAPGEHITLAHRNSANEAWVRVEEVEHEGDDG